MCRAVPAFDRSPQLISRPAVSLALALCFLAVSLPAADAPTAPTLKDSTTRAHELIEAAVRRVGGAQRLQQIAALRYELNGDSCNGLQGFDPADVDSSAPIGKTTFTADYDYAHHQARRRIFQILPGGIRLDALTYFRDGRITSAYPGRRRMIASAGPESAVIDSLIRYNPVLLAQRALANISSATYIGEQIEDGQLQDIVDISGDPSTRLRLHLARGDARILSLEAVGSDPLEGDDTVRYVFSGERTIAGLAFADEVAVFRHNRLYLKSRATRIDVNPTFDPAEFTAPSFRLLTTATSVNPLGNGAYEITGIEGGVCRVIFFDLGDAVAVFDAPESRTRSAWVADQIRGTVGPKPIKYLIVSHFHDDHVAGVGYYVDKGAQIVTVRANAAVLSRYATVQSRLHPDAAAATKAPSFLFVDRDRLELKGSSGASVVVYKLADCPHAKDMLIAYQPSGRLAVQADLFVELAAYSPTSAEFSRWMAGPAAPPIERIAGTHLGEISRAEFEAEAPASSAGGKGPTSRDVKGSVLF